MAAALSADDVEKMPCHQCESSRIARSDGSGRRSEPFLHGRCGQPIRHMSINELQGRVQPLTGCQFEASPPRTSTPTQHGPIRAAIIPNEATAALILYGLHSQPLRRPRYGVPEGLLLGGCFGFGGPAPAERLQRQPRRRNNGVCSANRSERSAAPPSLE